MAGARTLGTHPYMVPVEHTAEVRAALGDGPLILAELTVVLGSDAADARARAPRSGVLLPAAELRADVGPARRRRGRSRHGGSDRLVDALYAFGSVDQVGERVREHLDAGADHVCLKVLTNAPMTGVDERLPREGRRELAPLARAFDRAS